MDCCRKEMKEKRLIELGIELKISWIYSMI